MLFAKILSIEEQQAEIRKELKALTQKKDEILKTSATPARSSQRIDLDIKKHQAKLQILIEKRFEYVAQTVDAPAKLDPKDWDKVTEVFAQINQDLR